ncbi:hypothetical protein LX99_04812 [Mucilaginibacter oryzae]|uniref:Uncharacterized protein n=1 Tax=Mucilaginibacter oryzae TaxID=468058 RepID=A0A316GW69_9SPHI|nr:hypothetical protein LX99_04812 [Mucilaginibacter oryzae]
MELSGMINIRNQIFHHSAGYVFLICIGVSFGRPAQAQPSVKDSIVRLTERRTVTGFKFGV